VVSKNERLKILGDIQDLLGIADTDLAKLPQMVRGLLQTAASPPCLVAFAFDPRTGQLRQVAVSRVPQVPEAYAGIAQAATHVAQQFQNIALEVAKHVGESDRMEQDGSSRLGDERGTGSGRDGHEVGQVVAEGHSNGPPDQ